MLIELTTAEIDGLIAFLDASAANKHVDEYDAAVATRLKERLERARKHSIWHSPMTEHGDARQSAYTGNGSAADISHVG